MMAARGLVVTACSVQRRIQELSMGTDVWDESPYVGHGAESLVDGTGDAPSRKLTTYWYVTDHFARNFAHKRSEYEAHKRID